MGRGNELLSYQIVGRNQEKTAHSPECMLKLNQFPGGYFISCLERISDLWTPGHYLIHDLSGLLPIPSPKAASSSSLGTIQQG